jgi:hypothetical protein
VADRNWGYIRVMHQVRYSSFELGNEVFTFEQILELYDSIFRMSPDAILIYNGKHKQLIIHDFDHTRCMKFTEIQ